MYKKGMCERASVNGTYSFPSCFTGRAQYEVTVIYTELPSGAYDKDVLYLCESCKDGVVEDAECHGYTVEVAELK